MPSSRVSASGWFEIDLLFEHVDPLDGHIEEVADLIDFFCFAPAKSSARGFVNKEISLEGGDVYEPCEQKLRQLDEETEIPDIHNHGAELLAFSFRGLKLEKFELLKAYGFLFGIRRRAFRGGNMLGHGPERRGVGAGFRDAELTFEGAMDDEVAVAPDRACEVCVVGFREAVVAERLWKIPCTFETFQKRDFDGRGKCLAMQGGEQFLEFGTVGEVSGADSLGGGEFAELGEFLGVRLFMNAVDGGLLPVLEFAGHKFIRKEHEFLDELMGNIVFHALEPHGTP